MIDPLQVFACKLLIENEGFEAFQRAMFASVFYQCFGLVEVEIRMAAQAVYTGVVDGDATDGGGVETKPVGQLSVVEVDFFQLAEAVEAAQFLSVSTDEACKGGKTKRVNMWSA